MPIFLTVQEVAGILRRKVRRVYAYLEEGAFPNAKKLRGGWLIPESDVKALLDGLPPGHGDPPPARPASPVPPMRVRSPFLR